jgi:hypothetical protein
MARVVLFGTTAVRTSFPIQNGDPAALNSVRLQRMLRELGCISYPLVAKRLIDIEPEIRANSEAREEPGSEEAIHGAIDPNAEPINRALAEMMARILFEQQAITETRVRAAAEICAKVETVEFVSHKYGVLRRVLFPFRYRLPH